MSGNVNVQDGGWLRTKAKRSGHIMDQERKRKERLKQQRDSMKRVREERTAQGFRLHQFWIKDEDLPMVEKFMQSLEQPK